MKSKAIKNVLTTVGLPVLFGALIFALWQTKVLHALFGTDEIILPLPTRIGCVMGILMYIILLTVEAIVLKNRRAR